MTDQPTPTAATAASPGRGVKIALAVSVALNLAVAGLAAGAWMAEGPRRGMPREMSFGPFSEALSDGDRRALRRALIQRMGEFRQSREAARAEFSQLLEVLRAEPFDPAALREALGAIETRNAERLALGRSLIEERLVAMSATQRAEFADRLERGLGRGGRD